MDLEFVCEFFNTDSNYILVYFLLLSELVVFLEICKII